MYGLLVALGILALVYIGLQSVKKDTTVVRVHSSCPNDARPVQQRNVLEDGVETDVAFSWLNQDISQGNPISWSGKPNATDPFRPGQTDLCGYFQKQRDPKLLSEIVVQGHTVPLANELYTSRATEPSIVPFAGMRASPLCCPSSLTTSTGCVCGT